MNRALLKRTSVALAVLALAAGVFFGWRSLAALGLTTFIVSLLPCLVMCALGICVARTSRKGTSCNSPQPPEKETP